MIPQNTASRPSSTPAQQPSIGKPRLAAPASTAVGIIAALAGLAWLALPALSIADGFILADSTVIEQRRVEVRHPGGTVAKVYVTAGQRVQPGQILATIDAQEIDAKIDALRKESEAAQLRLESLRREVQGFNVLAEMHLISRTRVAELEKQVATMEGQAASVLARISQAEQQLAGIELRSPVAGVVEEIGALTPGRRLASGQPAATIVPDPDRISMQAALTPQQAQTIGANTAAKVWLGTDASGKIEPIPAKMVALGNAPDSDRKLATFELMPATRGTPMQNTARKGMRAKIVIGAGPRSLLAQLIEPARPRAGHTSPQSVHARGG